MYVNRKKNWYFDFFSQNKDVGPTYLNGYSGSPVGPICMVTIIRKNLKGRTSQIFIFIFKEKNYPIQLLTMSLCPTLELSSLICGNN